MFASVTLLAANTLYLAQAGNTGPIKDWESTGCVVDGVPTLQCLDVVFGNLLFMSSALVGLILFVMFLLGSWNYLTSFGDPEKINAAQGTFRWAIIGLILFVSAYLILFTIDFLFLGGKGVIFNFHIPGPNDALTPTP